MLRGPCGLCGSTWDEPDELEERIKGICPNCCPRRSAGTLVSVGRLDPYARARNEMNTTEGKEITK